jgi:DNA-binding CsgD family transcriptional regulator
MDRSALTPDAFAPAIAALGRAAFASELLAALNRAVPVDHVCLMRIVDRARPPVLESASWRGGTHVAEVQRAYLDGMYRFDPNLNLPARPEVAVLRLRRESLEHAGYREACYARAGLLERITVAAMDEGQRVFLNLYRLEPSGPFAAGEVATIEELSQFLAALAVKHVGTLGMLLRSRNRGDRVAALAARLHALDGRLTRRETDVLSRVLLGVTSEGIALDLGIGINTVLTYRKRAYARLGVTSQAELFSLCL